MALSLRRMRRTNSPRKWPIWRVWWRTWTPSPQAEPLQSHGWTSSSGRTWTFEWTDLRSDWKWIAASSSSSCMDLAREIYKTMKTECHFLTSDEPFCTENMFLMFLGGIVFTCSIFLACICMFSLRFLGRNLTCSYIGLHSWNASWIIWCKLCVKSYIPM